jgi:hypothetical protein
MNAKNLGIYVNDHLAGSVAALELLTHLISTNTGTARGNLFFELRQEIEQDQTTLRDLLQQLDFKESPIRKWVAWFSERVTHAKLLLEDPAGNKLARLERMEALALGVEGKRALWTGLKAVADHVPAIRSLDLTSLEQRAQKQRQQIESVRLDSVREAFL